MTGKTLDEWLAGIVSACCGEPVELDADTPPVADADITYQAVCTWCREPCGMRAKNQREPS